MWGGCFLPEESVQDFHNISTARMKKSYMQLHAFATCAGTLFHLLKRAVCKPPWDNNIMHIILPFPIAWGHLVPEHIGARGVINDGIATLVCGSP